MQVAELVLSGQLPARIDSQNKTLHRRTVDKRDAGYRKVGTPFSFDLGKGAVGEPTRAAFDGGLELCMSRLSAIVRVPAPIWFRWFASDPCVHDIYSMSIPMAYKRLDYSQCWTADKPIPHL